MSLPYRGLVSTEYSSKSITSYSFSQISDQLVIWDFRQSKSGFRQLLPENSKNAKRVNYNNEGKLYDCGSPVRKHVHPLAPIDFYLDFYFYMGSNANCRSRAVQKCDISQQHFLFFQPLLPYFVFIPEGIRS